MICWTVLVSPVGAKALGEETPWTPNGDTYSFHHQLGALIDGIFQCFSEQMSGMDDNTVLFDGFSEFLDPYLDGNQPLVFEFETPGSDDEFTVDINSLGTSDLFPEGFTDPKTGTPLTDACVEIGIDDTLDSDPPADVTSATLEFLSGGSTVIPPTDITGFFDNPWDGRLSIVVGGMAGQGIDEVRLQMQMQPTDGSIFADGFESGDASSWTDSVP